MGEFVQGGGGPRETLVAQEGAQLTVEAVDLGLGGAQGGAALVGELKGNGPVLARMGPPDDEPGGGEPRDERGDGGLAQPQGAGEFPLGAARPLPHGEQRTELSGGDSGGGHTAPVRGRTQPVRGPLQEKEQPLIGPAVRPTLGPTVRPALGQAIGLGLGFGHDPILTDVTRVRDSHFTSEVRPRSNEVVGVAVKDSLDLAAAREALAAQPFSNLLGTRLVAFGKGEAVLELDIRDDLRQQNGFVHGGVLGYAADNALTFAAGSAVGARVLTSGFTIDYLRPADGTLLRAHAHVVRAGRTRVVCRCDLSTVDAEGTQTLCAVAQGTIAVRATASGGATAVPADY